MITKNFKHFKNRDERASFIKNEFEQQINESDAILDVGCDNNVLKKIIGTKVTGVDIGGSPDFKIDLDKDKLSQFKNNSFDLAVCTEVLEHLDNLHEMMDELFRVSKKYVLISVPNCMDLYTKYNLVLNNKAGKYYGLPFEKQLDRHKWFFSWKDADDFMKFYTKKHGYSVIKKFIHFNLSNSIKANVLNLVIKIFNLNSASQSYWIIIKK